jgi:hypothetical protein
MMQCVWETRLRKREDGGYALLGREICESKLLRFVTGH